ncbi:probable peptidylglycine alpha-hydroxylating monooxygenase 1 [Paramacrobiotus metropolitanus]|uniref:probable peptidylglycine alpha-hydroxylating monooxygenase 1 n=1 Tax=Paramacrobiotus metropolitanus TaxID=2943436 RepID=UPI0024461F89|nr:probable peptidylglycine alpha-hydroxylating monooxygenase 1 [Paramacrobiotus metropolitanus]
MDTLLRMTILLTSVVYSLAVRVDRTPMLMPGAAPKSADTYLCYAMKLNGNVNQNLVGFLPNVSHSVHHMILYGCPEPGSQERVWNCGSEMQMKHAGHDGMADEQMDISPVCQSDEKILYAWAHNAPNFELPEGVGFEVGGNTPIQYLVVQLHYNDLTEEFKKGKKDHSGLTLLHTMDELPRQAGVIVMMSNGRVPAKHDETVDIACPLMEYSELHPFAYRTHTHTLGRVVSGYVIQDGKWQLLGKRDPQTPQMFYPVADDKLVIKPGDTLAARCAYSNPSDHDVSMGSTMNDEMCNFYLMYWTEAPYSPIEQDSCVSLGPPYVYWETFGLKDIPADSTKL